jgi:hypothetical protein
MPVMEAESQGRPFLALAAACGVFLSTFVLASCAFEGKTPTQLFTTTRPATTAAPAVGGGWSTQLRNRRSVALADGPAGISSKKTGQYKDIDGQGNVYAIEPKMAVEKDGEGTNRLLFGGIVGVIALVVAAGGLGRLSDFQPSTTLSYKGPPLTELSAQIQRQI